MSKKDKEPDMKFNYDRTRKRVIREIRKYEPSFTMGQKKENLILRLNSNIYKLTAILIIAIALGSAIYKQNKTKNMNSALAVQYYTTKPGENLKCTLSDGSVIRLNGGSSIQFAKKFTSEKREIKITGEAYCIIAKDKKRPFVVDLGDYKVEVLGTTFNVNAYQEDQCISIALVEGKVKVHQTKDEQILLKPEEMVTFDKKTQEHVKSRFDVENVTGWKNKVFVFDNVPILEVLKKLARRYGVTFKTEGLEGTKIRINAKFADESLATILKAISYGTELKFEVIENNLVKVQIK
ncbi:FecR family protein [Marinifilum sp.]|uniref:FecR family protein n=1 Tax=Marinifilum sp. TaxID=2033137 RepID=UPI003BACE9C4